MPWRFAFKMWQDAINRFGQRGQSAGFTLLFLRGLIGCLSQLNRRFARVANDLRIGVLMSFQQNWRAGIHRRRSLPTAGDQNWLGVIDRRIAG
jgi:hypothetical protein